MGLPNNTKKIYWQTPYSMTYGTKAVIPVEINMSSMRVSDFSPANNEELM